MLLDPSRWGRQLYLEGIRFSRYMGLVVWAQG